MDVTQTVPTSYWRPFWRRRDALPALLLALWAGVWCWAGLPAKYQAWQRERTTRAALVEARVFQSSLEAQWQERSHCPTVQADVNSTAVRRVASAEFFEGHCALQLHLAGPNDARWGYTRLMLVLVGDRWICLNQTELEELGPLRACRGRPDQIDPPRTSHA